MRRLKLVTGLSAIALGAASLGGCGEGEGESAAKAQKGATAPSGEGEGGEGEGSEGEGEGAATATDKASYLSQLMMLRGHLKAGGLLYASGDSTLAAAHMKHPHDELYASLKPAMESFGAQSFDGQLTAMASAVEGGQPSDAVDRTFASVREAVESASAASAPTIKDTLLAAALTLRQAGAEFDAGVEGGAIVNAKEYQDAYGFVATVVEILGTIEGAGPAEKEAVALAREQAALALAALPSIAPEAPLGYASTLYGAAARVEITAMALE